MLKMNDKAMSTNPVIVIAKFLVKPKERAFVKKASLELVTMTRKEEGCLSYDLHQDNKNPNQFLFYGNWKNYALWQKHMLTTHLLDYIKNTKDAVEKVDLHEMTNLSL
mgnify:CR=1 FL=1